MYNDANLRKMLLTCERCRGSMSYVRERNDFVCSGCGSNKAVKIHALFGLHAFPEHTYESLKATDGTADDKYTRAKSAVFALMYGGTEHTLAERLGVPTEIGAKALASFHRQFPGVKRFQQGIYDAFASMRQPGGIGSKVEWHQPADYRETMFKFRRYFTLENQICRALYELAMSPPKSWLQFKGRVKRRADRVQTTHGAAQTALFACAFALQAANCRAAANHDIQSAGATITKMTQRRIWDLQPSGVGEWVVQPLNVHDEIQCSVKPGHEEAVRQRVMEAVESVRPKVPLIKIDWESNLKSWADKS